MLAARQALASRPALAAGPIAGLVVWATHAAVDWDWEMPAVTLLAILLAGGLLALCERARLGCRSVRHSAPMSSPSAATPT